MEIWDGDQWRLVGGAKVRALLAVFLAQLGRHLPLDRLVAEIWGDDPPPSATTLVRGYVLTLRRAFGADGARWILGHGRGYRLVLPPDTVDAHRFDALCAEGHRALRRGDAEDASLLLTDALALYRGPAFTDAPPTPAGTVFAAALEERRLLALEARIEAHLCAGAPGGLPCGGAPGGLPSAGAPGDLLGAGAPGDLLGELKSLVDEHPTRERLVGQWMRALQATGRRAEALDAYRRAYERLAERSGISPGPHLRAVHSDILAAERTEHAPPDPRPVPAERWVVAAQTPAGLADFVGRRAELERCRTALRSGDRPTTRVVAVSGAPGTGKSALAIRLAHELRSAYPDGQLHVDLGTAPGRTADPGEVLAGFLRATGVEDEAVPRQTAERAALLRTRVADRRVLFVLENAADEPSVRPLIPGGAGCAVVVTSRTRLSGLAGCLLVDLDVFTSEEAWALLDRVVGPVRLATQPRVGQRLIELCGALPLAVRIVAARAAAAPATPLSWFAGRLLDERRRLDELRLHDLDVRAALRRAWALLDGRARLMLRQLAVLEVAFFPAWLPGAVTGFTERGAEEALRTLVDKSLLVPAGVDRYGSPRYRLHPLTRLFAREQPVAGTPSGHPLTPSANGTRPAPARAVPLRPALPRAAVARSGVPVQRRRPLRANGVPRSRGIQQ